MKSAEDRARDLLEQLAGIEDAAKRAATTVKAFEQHDADVRADERSVVLGRVVRIAETQERAPTRNDAHLMADFLRAEQRLADAIAALMARS